MLEAQAERMYPTPDTEAEHRFANPDHWERYEFAGQLASDKSILDVACGAGYGTALLARLSEKGATGLDKDPEAISWAQKYYGSWARYLLIQQPPWPLQDNSFDLVVSLETIEHIADPKPFLSELRRVLKTGERLVLSSPRNETDTRFHPGNPFHLREYTWDELGELVSGYFEIESRWSQVSNLSQQIQSLKDKPWTAWTMKAKSILPMRSISYLRALLTKRHNLRAGRILQGIHPAANVQLIIARKR
jgi:SAM-dependent methyltransferase